MPNKDYTKQDIEQFHKTFIFSTAMNNFLALGLILLSLSNSATNGVPFPQALDTALGIALTVCAIIEFFLYLIFIHSPTPSEVT